MTHDGLGGQDLDSAKALAVNTTDHAHTIAMLLQMVFEKLAKAYLAHTNPTAFRSLRRSHAAALRFTQFLKLQRNFLPNVGPQTKKVIPWIEALTKHHPALEKLGPHLEYPWFDQIFPSK